MKSGILLTATGAAIGVAPANGTDYTLEELQGLVEGYIEIVTLTENTIMVVNEEGKGCLPKNVKATVMAKALGAIFPEDYIAGDALLCASDMVK